MHSELSTMLLNVYQKWHQYIIIHLTEVQRNSIPNVTQHAVIAL